MGRRRPPTPSGARAMLIVDPPAAGTSRPTSPAAAGAGCRRSRATRTPRSTSRACAWPIRCARTGSRRSRPAARSPASSPAPTPSAASGRRRPASTPTLVGVAELTANLTDGENGQLNPLGVNCLRTLPGDRPRRLGRAHAARRRPARLRVEVRPGPAPGAVHRGEPLPRHAVGGVRAERRAAVGADPAQRRRVHAEPVPAGRVPGHARRARRTSSSATRETTTQNDINLGIVNILVGFAPLKPAEFVVIKIQQMAGQIADLRSERMAQFTVNAQRFDPYKNFKFRVKWDGRYVAGVSKVGALKRTTEVVEHREGGDPSTSRKSPGPHQVRGDHARARRHPRHRVRAVGEQGLELRRRPRRGGLAQGLPQGHHHRGLQRGRPARARLQGLPLLGLGVPGAAGPRRQRQRRRDPAHQARERRLGARLRRDRADRAELHRAAP